MTDSSGISAGFEDIPPSALTASLLATDHDVAGRIARGNDMLRRDVRDRGGVSRLVVDLTEWTAANRELLATRFVSRTVADAYVTVAEPFVVPAESSEISSQIDLLHRQLRHQVEWLERLRLTIPERQQPASVHLEPRLARSHVARRPVAVLATTASPSAATVVEVVARATGKLPVVIEDHPGARRSLVSAAEDAVLPSNAIAVVVLESPSRGPKHASTSSLLALGYAAGALGIDSVIAVLTPGVTLGRDLREFTAVVMEDDDGWRGDLDSLLGEAVSSASAVVSSIRRP